MSTPTYSNGVCVDDKFLFSPYLQWSVIYFLLEILLGLYIFPEEGERNSERSKLRRSKTSGKKSKPVSMGHRKNTHTTNQHLPQIPKLLYVIFFVHSENAKKKQ